MRLAQAVQRKNRRRKARDDAWRREALHEAWRETEEGRMVARGIELIREHLRLSASDRVRAWLAQNKIGETITMARHLIWAALLLPSLANAQSVTMANISGTITNGGQAQTLAGVNPTRRGCVVQNLSTGDLWINDQGAAAASQPSIKVPAGAQFACGSPGSGAAPTSALSIFGATTAQAFAGREW